MAAAGAPPDRRSDVDFADVFGGPPRRSSGHDHQWQRRSSLDSSFGSVSRARSGPVFGERTSSDRGRLLGDEFYRDIFPGSESASPRRGAASGDWDVFGAPSSPGFRSRPRMSFSVKFTSGVDNPVPTSPSRHIYNRNDDGTSYAYSVPSSPNSSMNNFLAEGAPQQDSRKNPFSWHCYPFLSRFVLKVEKRRTPLNLIMSALWTVNVKGLLLARKVSLPITTSIFHSISGRGKGPY